MLSPFKKIVYVLLCLLSAQLYGQNIQQAEEAASEEQNPEVKDKIQLPLACIIPIEGEVKKLLDVTFKRRIERAKKDGVKLIIFSVKSDGGRLDSAMGMSNYVFNLDSKIRTIAYVNEKAYSAAALFSLACDDIYMKSRSSIGDCQPIMQTSEAIVPIGEKIQTVLRERFRSFAKGNGYPVLLAQAMVTQELKILSMEEIATGKRIYKRSEDLEIMTEEEKKKYKDTKIEIYEGELLTMGSKEALEMGFSRGTFESVEALLKHLGYQTDVPVSDLTETEKFLDSFESLASMLLVLGIFFLYLEMKTPGIGLFASLGALCFAAFFVGKFYSGQANYIEVLLFLIGIGLILVEVFIIPGFGITGVAGGLCIFVSLILATQDFTIPQNEGDWQLLFESMSLVSTCFLIASAMFFMMVLVLPKLGFKGLPGLVHSKHQEASPSFVLKHLHASDAPLLGKKGVSTTPLHPSGKATIEGKSLQVVSQGAWVEKDRDIVVTKQQGNFLTVKETSSPS